MSESHQGPLEGERGKEMEADLFAIGGDEEHQKVEVVGWAFQRYSLTNFLPFFFLKESNLISFSFLLLR